MVESKLSCSFLNNQKGQGTIEYVLLLVITISMILLAMTNIFKPLQSFMQNYMGTYVACLLTSGELPAIRVENEMKNTEARCSFDLRKGNGTIDGNSSGRNGNGSGNNNDSNGRGGAGKNGAGGASSDPSGKEKSSVDGDSGSGGKSSFAGSRSRRAGFGARAKRGATDSGGSDSDSAGGKRYVNALNNNKNDRFFKNQQRSRVVGYRKGRGVTMGGMTDDERQNEERQIQAQPRKVATSNEEFSVPGKKNVLKPPPEKEKKVAMKEDTNFSFGNFFKYILIAVVLLLIFILGGGQAFEVSKTMD